MPFHRRVSPGVGAALWLALTLSGAIHAQTPSAPGDPVRSPGNATWASTLREARERAASQRKFLFVEFDSTGCGNCQRMDTLLYRALEFENLLVAMVPIKLSMDSGEGAELARELGVKEAPAVLIRSPEGRMVVLMEGFLNPGDFYSNIRKELDAYREFARKVDSQDVSRLSVAEALETGRELLLRGDPAGAVPRFQRAASHPGAKAAERDTAREMLAAAQLESGDPKASRQTIDRLIGMTRDKQTRERAELFRAQLPLAENRPQEADALYRKFEKDHPDSKYLPQVRAIRQRIAAANPSS